jgi:hypothetical protein
VRGVCYLAHNHKEKPMSPTIPLQQSVAASLQRWHQLVAERNLSKLPELLHPQAVFRSPMAHKPYAGAPMVNLILNTVLQVFQDFAYHRELATGDGLSVVLEFSARVGERELKGIDMIRFDEAGKIVDFEVMIRPMSGLQALGDEMAKRLAPFLAGARAKS